MPSTFQLNSVCKNPIIFNICTSTLPHTATPSSYITCRGGSWTPTDNLSVWFDSTAVAPTTIGYDELVVKIPTYSGAQTVQVKVRNDTSGRETNTLPFIIT